MSFLRPLLRKLVEVTGTKNDSKPLLSAILKGPLALGNDAIEAVVEHLLATFLAKEDTDGAKFKDLLEIFQQRYPEILDLVIEKTLKVLPHPLLNHFSPTSLTGWLSFHFFFFLKYIISKSLSGSPKSKKSLERIFQFVGATFKGTRHQPLLGTNTTLYLSCIHADANTRFIGLKQMYEETKKKTLPLVSLISSSVFVVVAINPLNPFFLAD